MKTDVLPPDGVPECQVHRVKIPGRNHRLVAHRGPADPVGRGIDVQSAGRLVDRNDRLVAVLGRAIGIGVLEGHKCVADLSGENDVVLFRPTELDQAQFRALPVNAVMALGVAGHVVGNRVFSVREVNL